jgi:hypothetical protein
VAVAAGLALAVALSGCASLSREDCLRGDWTAIGYKDGLDGRPATRLSDHFEACTDYGVSPNPTVYRNAWASGVQVYCQPGSGFEAGASGKTYHGVCPPDLEGPFLSAYRAGHGLYERRQAVESLEDDLRRTDGDLDDIDETIRAREAALADGERNTDARERLHTELRGLAEQRGVLRERRDRLRRDLDDARRDLDLYQERLRYR